MDIKQVVKRRLRQQLADEKAIFEANQAAREAQADAIAQKEANDAVTVAAQIAADDQARADAEWSIKLESAASSGIAGDIGTVAERDVAMARLGMSRNAIGRAAASRGNLNDDDLISYDADGTRHHPAEQFVAVVSALMGIYRSQMNADERKAQDELDKRRADALTQLADKTMAEFEDQLATQRKMEDA